MTTGYSNVNNFIVILADDRDPEESWRRHRGGDKGLGGVDCVARIGTPLFAPADCLTLNIPNNGTGGNTVTMSFSDGWADQFMHLSGFVPAGRKSKGDLVGYSGDSGAPGQPHVHWHRINAWYRDQWGTTNRYNPWHYFTSTASGGGSTPIEEEDMTPEQVALLSSIDYVGRQILAGVLGVDAQGNGIALNPNVNWGQPLIYGQQEARKGIQAMLDRPQGIVDVVALAAALRPMVDSGATAEQIAVAVGQHLADDFARVNANIDDQPTTFEITPKG